MVVKGVVHVTVPSLNNKHEDILVDILGEEAFFFFMQAFVEEQQTFFFIQAFIECTHARTHTHTNTHAGSH